MQYHCLIAGLPDYPFDAAIAAAAKFDVQQTRARIKAQLTPADRRVVELLYRYYDVVNLVNALKSNRLPFHPLGNLSPEAVAWMVETPVINESDDENPLAVELIAVPDSISLLISRFKGSRSEEEDSDDRPQELTATELENQLFALFYAECARSTSDYLRRWADTDRTVRNIIAAYRARTLGLPAEQLEAMLVDAGELCHQLLADSASDFGLKGEFAYIDPLMIVLETPDFVERERKMDLLRWEIAEDLAEHDYFGIGQVLSFLIRVNLLHRWVALDPDHGRESFRAKVGELTSLANIGTHPSAEAAQEKK